MTKTAAAPARRLPPLVKLALELGPLAVFFVLNGRADLFVATGGFMAATAVALAVSFILVRRLPVMPIVSGAVVLVFGTLTLAFHDETFIKLKPTIVNLLFAGVLLGGLAFGRSLIGHVFDEVLRLDEEGWRKLTLRWGLFFVFLAILNEVVWRAFSTDFWVSFKVFGVLPLTIAFAMAQIPLMQRHTLADNTTPEEALSEPPHGDGPSPRG